ncbi:hypothetical protein Cgig2_018068 [Carnegiea gigantea]|uniref:Uncharacterized protein n=1 Tax=Carnegiea gigantea TaxID=171969 RepID=A0A9Q1QF65_9CARY|nr:hypothetical protein Cgig2_018068 [Carnegiea gigantea]
MATCSSSITDGSAESDGANNHDLANFSTKACLAKVSATKKSAVRACVVTEGSPTTRGVICSLLRDPLAAVDPRALSEAKRSTDHRSWAGPLVSWPFEEGGPVLRVQGKTAEGSVSGRFLLESPHACSALPSGAARSWLGSALQWLAWPQGATTSPALILHVTKERQLRPKGKRKHTRRMLFLSLYYLGHKRGNRPRMVVLPNNVVEIASRFHLNLGRRSKRISDRLLVVPVGKMPLTHLSVHEKKVTFPIFNLTSFLWPS